LAIGWVVVVVVGTDAVDGAEAGVDPNKPPEGAGAFVGAGAE
jgi:hypothetical protein